MKHLHFCLILLSVCFIIACSDKEELPEITPGMGSEIYFSDAMNFDSNAGVNHFNFMTNKDWTLTVANTINGSQWCRVSQTSGNAGEISIEVCVDANNGYDDRSVALTIQAGELTKTVMITQKQKDALTLTTNRFEIGQEGGTIKVEVKANVSYEVIIPESCNDWISKATSSRGLSNSILFFTIEQNQSIEKREGVITILSNNMSEKIKIYQEGEKKTLLLSKNEFNVKEEGENIQVEVNSNFDFGIKIPQVEWLHLIESRTISSHTLFFCIDSNLTYNQRTAEIIFYDKSNDSNIDTLKIIQENKEGLYFSLKDMEKLNISHSEQTLDIVVYSTFEEIRLQISDQNSWLRLRDKATIRLSDVLFEHKYLFYAEKNSDIIERTINVLFEKSSNKDVFINSIITQQGNTEFEDDYWDGSIAENMCAGGEGTLKSPYLITTCSQLAKLSEEVNNGRTYSNCHFKLLANLNLANLDWIPIGAETTPFSGLFDGNGKSIKYLFMSKSYDYSGLFGHTSNANINNITVWSIGHTGEKYTGTLIGYANQTKIDNCDISSDVSSYKYAGGIIGYAKDSYILNSSHSGTIRTSGGGLVGYMEKSKIINCYNTGTIKGKSVGGLVRYNMEESEIINSYNRANFKDLAVMENDLAGGIVAINAGTIINCYNAGNMEIKDIEVALFPSFGGIAAITRGSSKISNCFFLKQYPVNSYLKVTGGSQVGGNVALCESFNGSGIFNEGIIYSGRTYIVLSQILNSWVANNQTYDNLYSPWNISMAWPEFVEKK